VNECVFCRIVAGEVPAEVVHATETTVAFRDANPVAPVHVLVVPRRHITDAAAVEAADGPELADLVTSARAVARAEGIDGPERGYRLVLNVGADAQNSVPHLHLHVVGGRSLAWPPG
jgi:histidine triad (HIT) family protein